MDLVDLESTEEEQRSPVKIIFWRLPRKKVVAKFEDFLNTGGFQKSSQPSIWVGSKVSNPDLVLLPPHVEVDCPLVLLNVRDGDHQCLPFVQFP